jgi:TonB family protein
MWMLQVVLVSALLALAAAAAEHAASNWRAPARTVWVVALLGVVLLPLAALVRPSWWSSGGASLGIAEAIVAAPLASLVHTAGSTVDPSTVRVSRPVFLAWCLVSAAIFAWLMHAEYRLRRLRRSWRVGQMEGEQVLVSRDSGPAVAGFLRPRVVVPEWVLDLDPARRRMILRHELEHIRAHDHRVWRDAVLTVIALPWNLPGWWMLRRLRLSMERDCDRRVVAAGENRVAYGRLLLEMGERRRQYAGLTPALAEPRSLLETRIRSMLKLDANRTPLLSVFTGAAALFMAITACEMAGPAAGDSGPDKAMASSEARSHESLSEKPATPPVLLNVSEVAQALEADFPPGLRATGVEGSVRLWMHVDENGTLEEVAVEKSSGHPEFDDVALRLAALMRFEPARDEEGVALPAWISQPVDFRVK